MCNRALRASLASLLLSACGGPDGSSDPSSSSSSSATDLTAMSQPARDFWVAALGGTAPDARTPGCVMGQSGNQMILNTGLAISGTGLYQQRQGLMTLHCSLAGSSFLLPVLTVSDDDGVVPMAQRPDAARMGAYVEDMLGHARSPRVVVDGRILRANRAGLWPFGVQEKTRRIFGMADGLFVSLPSLARGVHVIEVQAQVAGYRADTRMMLDVR